MRGLRIDISVVSGSDPEMLRRCLGSLYAHYGHWRGMRVFVTINASGLQLADQLCHDYPAALVRLNAVPLGFAANHNRVISQSDADYVVVLNDDLEFLDSSLDSLLSFMESPEGADVAVATPRLVNPDGSLQHCTYSFPTVSRALLGFSRLRGLIGYNAFTKLAARCFGYGGGKSRFWNHHCSCDVDTFRGACMVVRGIALSDIGLMSEASLVGGEETEWHYRFRRAGWRIRYFNDARVVHYGGQTVSKNPLLAVEYFRGFRYFFEKHGSSLQRFSFNFGSRIIFSIRYAIGALLRSSVERDVALGCLRAMQQPVER